MEYTKAAPEMEMTLTIIRGEGSVVGMMKKLSKLPLNLLLQTLFTTLHGEEG